MKIENLRRETNGDRDRVCASVTWEDCDRPAHELYFETDAKFSKALTCNPHAFLTGSLLPAFHHREKRVFIDGEICPELKEGLISAMSWIRHWFYSGDYNLVKIEARTKSLVRSGIPDRAGFFFSGGIDCLATLWVNRLNFPSIHPGYLRDGLLIYGQNIESDTSADTFKKAYLELSAVTAETGVSLIPVYTNVRQLDENKRVFHINHGAILGAVAHAFSGELTSVCVSASDSIPGLAIVKSLSPKPYGSHPLLDPCFSSSELKILHDGINLTRLEKTKLISDWDSGLRNIKVCGPNWPGNNCGRCEKCIRTMLELLASGVLAKSGAFPAIDISAEQVENLHIRKPVFDYGVDDDYLELISPLKEIGRHDLAAAIETALHRPHRRKNSGFGPMIRDIDRKYLLGILAGTKKKVSLAMKSLRMTS
jgi:hypothetical protein